MELLPSPFFPRIASDNTLHNGLPTDTHSLVMSTLDLNDIINLRICCKENLKDQELRTAQLLEQKKKALETQRSQLLETAFLTKICPPGEGMYSLVDGTILSSEEEKKFFQENISSYMEQLKQFNVELQEVFSKQKSLPELEEKSHDFKSMLLKEEGIAKNNCERILRASQLIDVRRKAFFNLLLIEIKLLMVEQELYIRKYTDSRDQSLVIEDPRSSKVENDLRTNNNMVWFRMYLGVLHANENAAAVFSSDPYKMRKYIEEQHAKDNELRLRLMEKEGHRHNPYKIRELEALQKIVGGVNNKKANGCVLF